MTRWFVEVSPLDADALKERYCVEAEQWQQALQVARKLREERGPLSRFAIEVTDAGYRAVDPAARLRYVVTKAPDDAELTRDAPPASVLPARPAPPPIEAPPELTGTRLLYQRAEEPTDSVPITYREYAFAVAPWATSDELRAIIDQLFSQVHAALSDRAQGKFVQLALFDHVFEGAPERLPLATLAWKDWRGDAVVQINVPQAPAKSAPAQPPEPDAGAPKHDVEDDTVDSAFDALQVDAGHPASTTMPSPAAPAESKGPAAPAFPSQRPKAPHFDIPKAPRTPGLPAQERSAGASREVERVAARPEPPGPEAPPASAADAVASTAPAPDAIAETEAAPAPEPAPASERLQSVIPPSHEQRVRRGPEDDLISELFERMAELQFCPDLVSGIDLVLVTLWELLPCEGTLIHVYDIDRGGFVVVRAAGPEPARAILHRTPDGDPLLEEALRSGRIVRSDEAGSDPRFHSERWKKLGVEPNRALCAGVQRGQRFLGAIELANPITPDSFYENEENGLLYTCEHLADFIANRPIVLDDDVVIPRA